MLVTLSRISIKRLVQIWPRVVVVIGVSCFVTVVAFHIMTIHLLMAVAFLIFVGYRTSMMVMESWRPGQ